MAFMMPVVKNDYEIYRWRRRSESECSNPDWCRSRKVSEGSRSEGRGSLSTSPGSEPLHSPSAPFSRHCSPTSRNQSNSSLQSPYKSTSSSPPKNGSTSSLNKFHSRLVDRLKKSLKCKDGSNDEARRAS